MQGAPEAGATPTELRLKVLANGWSPLPVTGKAPTPTDWSRYCREAPTDGEVTFWGRSHPGALSTGLALGRQVGIDIDVASDPALAETVRGIAVEVFGPTPFVRVGRAPKLALVYRGGPDVVSAAYKAASGNGDGLDILADGRQLVGFGRHKETGLPYTWTGEASPFSARPDAAPVITAAQVADFVVRVEQVMPFGSGGVGGTSRKGGGPRNGIVRNATGLVSDGREEFLSDCIWAAAHDLDQARVDLTHEVLTDAAWSLFTDPTRGADLVDKKWRKADASYKAKLTLRRLEAGTVNLGPRVEADARPDVAPTYPDLSVPVDEARAAVRAALEAHFAVGTGQRAIRVSTGVGKTRIAAEVIAADVKRRRAADDQRAFLFAVPTHRLGDEVCRQFTDHGVTARVFRGRTALDPDMPDTGRLMCLDVEAVELALSLGATVSTSCCRGKHPATGTKVECPSFHACPYQGQLADRPAVWIVPHQLLFQAQAALGEVAGVVIDESFWGAGLKMGGKGMTVDEVGAEPAPPAEWLLDVAADVAAYRGRLARALRRQDGAGGVERRHLVAEGLDPDTCTAAIAAEWRLKASVEIWPGMGQQARRAAARASAGSKRVRTYAAIWDAARELLHREDVATVSGRLILADATTEEGTARVVRTRGVRPIAKAWVDAPTFIMDATLPALPILQTFHPDVEVVADIEAKAPHARVRQVVGAPTSANKLHRNVTDRNLSAVRRAILHRHVELGRPSTLVIAQQKTEDWLKASGLPASIEVRHFNAIAGLDGFKDVGLVVIVGRTMPSPIEVEAMAGAITGVEVVKTAEPAKGGPRWFDRTTLGVRLADGTGHAVQGDRHPDPIAEAVRWQIAEGEVVQAVGRARSVNRTAENPVEILILNDLALPLTVDEVVAWEKVPADLGIEMAVDGIVLKSAADMAACWPATFTNHQAAKDYLKRRTEGQTPIEECLYRDLPLCGLAYQRSGARQKWRQGWHDPAVLPDPRAWLEQRLGPLAGFEITTPDDRTDA